MNGTRIILATRNAGKAREIRAILGTFPATIFSLADFPELPPVVEDGETLEENALKKARQVFEATGIPALADDTGLEVFSLNLRPGVYSARYAGPNATYEDNNKKLLAELNQLPSGSARGARFRAIAAFTDGISERTTEGICAGRISEKISGTGGFGYDPLFVPEGFDLSFAEMSEEMKNLISHRGRAFRLMLSVLNEIFGVSQ